MLLRNHLPVLLAAAAFSAGTALAQEVVYKSEASAQFFGGFTSGTWYRGVQQTATDSGGVLANYRFFFNDYNGVEFNYGYTPDTQKFFGYPGFAAVKTDSHEATVDYVLRYPVHRVKPFALVGTGALVFDPRNGPPTVQARAAFVYGAGLDVGFAKRCFMRLQYRGLVYSSPDFNTYYLGPDRITHRAEPSIGFGFRF
jgi:opacity protein-like surface antigen